MSRVLLALAFALVLFGCRGSDSEQPMAGDLELCCKAANADNVSFVGCRATDHCRASESVWIRGPLTCTADTPDQCAGGRCCKLDLEALALRGGEAAPEPVVEVEPVLEGVEPAPTPEPAQITPAPYD